MDKITITSCQAAVKPRRAAEGQGECSAQDEVEDDDILFVAPSPDPNQEQSSGETKVFTLDERTIGDDGQEMVTEDTGSLDGEVDLGYASGNLPCVTVMTETGSEEDLFDDPRVASIIFKVEEPNDNTVREELDEEEASSSNRQGQSNGTPAQQEPEAEVEAVGWYSQRPCSTSSDMAFVTDPLPIPIVVQKEEPDEDIQSIHEFDYMSSTGSDVQNLTKPVDDGAIEIVGTGLEIGLEEIFNEVNQAEGKKSGIEQEMGKVSGVDKPIDGECGVGNVGMSNETGTSIPVDKDKTKEGRTAGDGDPSTVTNSQDVPDADRSSEIGSNQRPEINKIGTGGEVLPEEDRVQFDSGYMTSTEKSASENQSDEEVQIVAEVGPEDASKGMPTDVEEADNGKRSPKHSRKIEADQNRQPSVPANKMDSVKASPPAQGEPTRTRTPSDKEVSSEVIEIDSDNEDNDVQPTDETRAEASVRPNQSHGKCFNCDKNHMLRFCPEPRNHVMINKRRREFEAQRTKPNIRYFNTKPYEVRNKSAIIGPRPNNISKGPPREDMGRQNYHQGPPRDSRNHGYPLLRPEARPQPQQHRREGFPPYPDMAYSAAAPAPGGRSNASLSHKDYSDVVRNAMQGCPNQASELFRIQQPPDLPNNLDQNTLTYILNYQRGVLEQFGTQQPSPVLHNPQRQQNVPFGGQDSFGGNTSPWQAPHQVDQCQLGSRVPPQDWQRSRQPDQSQLGGRAPPQDWQRPRQADQSQLGSRAPPQDWQRPRQANPADQSQMGSRMPPQDWQRLRLADQNQLGSRMPSQGWQGQLGRPSQPPSWPVGAMGGLMPPAGGPNPFIGSGSTPIFRGPPNFPISSTSNVRSQTGGKDTAGTPWYEGITDVDYAAPPKVSQVSAKSQWVRTHPYGKLELSPDVQSVADYKGPRNYRVTLELERREEEQRQRLLQQQQKPLPTYIKERPLSPSILSGSRKQSRKATMQYQAPVKAMPDSDDDDIIVLEDDDDSVVSIPIKPIQKPVITVSDSDSDSGTPPPAKKVKLSGNSQDDDDHEIQIVGEVKSQKKVGAQSERCFGDGIRGVQDRKPGDVQNLGEVKNPSLNIPLKCTE